MLSSLKFFPVILFLVTVISICSCSNNQHELKVIEALNEGLENSNKQIMQQTIGIYYGLEEKLQDPKYEEVTKIWEPKTAIIKKLSTDMIAYIDTIKILIKQASGLKITDGKEMYDKENEKVISEIFIKEEKGKELYNKLLKYKKSILTIDPDIHQWFSKSIITTSMKFDTTISGNNDFVNTYFNNSSVISTLGLLSRFQNNIRILENNTVTFCDSKCVSFYCGYNVFGVLVNQSSNFVKQGEKIEIIAGVGAYSNAAKPQIHIQGKQIEVVDGRASYKLNTSNQFGKYKVPVKIEFTDQNGIKQTSESEVEYEVAKESPCN